MTRRIEVTEADVDGTTVTTITLPEEADAMTCRSAACPFAVESVSIAISDGTLLFGTGDFVTTRSRPTRASLARTRANASAVGELDANLGLVYVDIGGVMTTLDPLLSFVVDDWDDMSPWVAASTGSSRVGTADDSVISARLTLYVD